MKGKNTMARTGENIYKRKDGRWEARYIASYDVDLCQYFGHKKLNIFSLHDINT